MSKNEKLINRMTSNPTPRDATESEIIKYLNIYNFVLYRVKGSHKIFYNSEWNELFVLPIHNGKVKYKYIDILNEVIKRHAR